MTDAEEISQIINKAYDGRAFSYSWQRANEGMFASLKIQRNAMFIILSLIIIVAAFNIISSIIMLVQGKYSEIAIMRTFGASEKSILKIFISVGSMSGVIGTAIGFALGLPLAYNVDEVRLLIENITGDELLGGGLYYLSSLPSVVNYAEVFAVCFASIFISVVATIYPALKAARLKPARILRYE